MNDRKYLITLLRGAKVSAAKGNTGKLKQLSDQTVHNTTIYQDEVSILVAVVVYSLGKVVEKGRRYYKENFENYYDYYINNIDKLIVLLERGDEKGFKNQVKEMLTSKKFSKDLRINATNMFRKARINKASRIYEHGLSMERTAKLFGISLWELAEYSGQAGIADMKEGETLEVRERVKLAMEMFR